MGLVVDGLGAVAGTLLFYKLRPWLDHDLSFPDDVGALLVDALVIGAGWQIATRIQPAQRLV